MSAIVILISWHISGNNSRSVWLELREEQEVDLGSKGVNVIIFSNQFEKTTATKQNNVKLIHQKSDFFFFCF